MNRVTPGQQTPGPPGPGPDTAAAPLAMIAANATSPSVQAVLVIAWRGKKKEACGTEGHIPVPEPSVRASKNRKYKKKLLCTRPHK